jgi:signal transduction histidine kinase
VGTLLYIRLFGFTAGTLLMLFWMVVILGYRRQRNFERVFFFLCLSLFLFYGGSLLALNAQIYYVQPPPLLTTFAWTVLSAGLCFTPALLLHLHLEYASMCGLLVPRKSNSDQSKRLTLAFVYAFVVFFAIWAYPKLVPGQDFDFLLPARTFGPLFGICLGISLGGSAGWQFRFAQATAQQKEKLFHYFAGSGLSLCTLLVVILHVLNWRPSPQVAASLTTTLDFLPIPLFAALIYAVQKYNFLQIGRQTNLMYAISVTFLALLYLGLVRRVSGLLEPVLPPEATASILLFVLVIFVEPIQRLLGKRLHETAQHQMDDVRRLIVKIREKARDGDLRGFIQFIGEGVKQQFEFEEAWLEVLEPILKETIHDNSQKAGAEGFSVRQPGLLDAVLFVRPHGAMLSGEITAALELLCEQLPASIDLCRLIEEKLRLERELAERERMAVLGQMAASISHNLKNPLGSIKTILQVQMESADMPESLKAETRMVLGEVSRLSNKLGQLLQFSRPAVLGGAAALCDVGEIVNEVSEVMKHEAERKGIEFGVTVQEALGVTASREAVSDIVSNLVVNGLEASGYGGDLRVSAAAVNGNALICVRDDGKGIPSELREKVMQPFFTTKTQGTGLGLAIVARRVGEAGGRMELQSPVANGRGTKFSVWLPLRKDEVTE